MIKEEVKDGQHELRDFADDMVSFKEEETEQQIIVGLHKDLTAAKQQLTDMKEQIFVQSKSGGKYGIGLVHITKAE
eukprot:3907560-Heterocapsa_arctica.AAC.1